MRLKIIGNKSIVDKVNRVIERNFPHIQPINCIYNVYTEAAPMVKTGRTDCDAILFTGMSPYFISKKFIDPGIISEYLPRSTHSLLFAFLRAEKNYSPIQRVSIDTYNEKQLAMVYDEVGLSIETTPIDFVERDMLNQDLTAVIRQHEQFFQREQVSCCLTALDSVYKTLSRRGIPSILIEPTYEIIVETLHKLELTHIFNFTQRNTLVVIQIRIDEPKEYSLLPDNEYNLIMDKAKTLTYIHEFAKRLNAAVVEAKDENYLLFVADDVFSNKTNDLKNIDLLDQVRQNTYNTISLGIGYGHTIREAQTGARNALLQAIKSGGDRAFVANEGLFVYPVTVLGDKESRKKQAEDALEMIASNTGLSANIVFQISSLMQEMRKTTFTAKELASLLGINLRRMNRIIERLEADGLCSVLANRLLGSTGRPTRIIEFKQTIGQ